MAQILLKIFAFVVVSAQLTLSEEFTCPPSRGYYPHPKECNKYYSCRKRVSTLKVCPERMLFDIEKGNCYVDSAVDCGERKKSTVSVVTMGEIRTRTVSEANWNSHIVTDTTNKLSTPDSMLSTIDDNNVTSDALRTVDIEVDERNNTATIEANVSDEMLTTLSDNEVSSRENTLDGSNSTIFQTSVATTDTVKDSLDNNATIDHDIKTYSHFVSISELTDEDVTGITKLDNATAPTYENPETGVAELNDSVVTDLFTSNIDISSTDITTLQYINTTDTFEPNTNTNIRYQTNSTYDDTTDVTTDTVKDSLDNNATIDHDIKTYSPFVSISELTDEDVTGITKLDNATVPTYENPETGVAELNDSVVTDLFTSNTDISSTDITTLQYINTTNTFEPNTNTDIRYQTNSTYEDTTDVTTDTVKDSLDNNATIDHDIKTYSPFVSISEITDGDVTGITKLNNATVPTEMDITTYENTETGVAELNDSVVTDLFTINIYNSTIDITTLQYINTTETFEPNTNTDDPYQTKSTYEDTVYEYSTKNSLQNTSTDSNDTTTKEDKESSITDLINTNPTTYMPDVTTRERDDQNSTVVTEFDEISTKVSSETGLSHDEIITTVTEYFDPITTQSNTTTSDSSIVPDEAGNNTTSYEAVDSTTQVTQNINFETTDQNIVTEDQYPDDDYLGDFECPTAYGLYPHPNDKHKFLHCQEWYPHVMVCPANLIFDARLETCIWPWK